MIVKIETEISGNFLIEGDLKVKNHPYDIFIRFDIETKKHFISISKKIVDYLSYLPKLNIEENSLIIPSENFLEEQKSILRHIESFGAIDKGIKKIFWDNCSIEWIPELDNERKDLSICKYDRDFTTKTKKQVISKDWLQNTVIHRRQLEHLALPFSFFREGIDSFNNYQYQQSFINFYLMLEGFFANGEFKNEKVKSQFKNSPILVKAIKLTLDYLEKNKGKDYEWLINICNKYNKHVDEIGVIHFLVELRGNLSHFSINKPDKHKNPFKDNDFKSLALISMIICRFISIDLRLEPFRR